MINIVMAAVLAGFAVAAVLNIRLIATLPFAYQRGSRWQAITWLIMLVGLGQWFGRTSSVQGVASVDASAGMQILSIALASVVIVFLSGKYLRFTNLKLPLLLILMFGIEGLLTSPISDVPTLSVFKSFSVIVSVLVTVMAIKAMRDGGCPRSLYDTVYVYFVFIILLSVVGGVLFPELTHRENKGVFGFMLVGWPALNSNSLSYVAAVVFVISFRRIFMPQKLNMKLLYLSACSLGLCALLLAQGRTSIISSTLALLFMSYVIKDMRSVKYILSIVVLVMFGVFIFSGSVGDWVQSIELYLQRGVTDEQLSSLSGRTHAWSESWNLFMASPVTGYGFYAAGKTLLAPHNAYLTVMLNGGLLGFIPWLGAVIIGIAMIVGKLRRKAWSADSIENNYYKEMVAVIIVQFVRTVTGQDLTIHSYSLLMFMAVISYIIVRQAGVRIEASTEAVDRVVDNGRSDGRVLRRVEHRKQIK